VSDDAQTIRKALERDDKMAVSVPWLRGAVAALLAERDRLVRERDELRKALRVLVEWYANGKLIERETESPGWNRRTGKYDRR
jgi:hypothetical protein